MSKDGIKEILFDAIGFQCRAEKVQLGVSSANILYYLAEQLMRAHLSFILENNFETSSREALLALLERYGYRAITLSLTGDYASIHRRFLQRNARPERHLGHAVNDRYPAADDQASIPEIPYADFVREITARGMDQFTANGPRIVVDTTDFEAIDREALLRAIQDAREAVRRTPAP